jgi:hypothetical protein
MVARNSHQGGKWGNEEKEGARWPFKPDVTFDLMIVNEPYSYQIYINDEQFCAFAHRIDPHTIVSVEVVGDLDLHSIIMN